RGPALRGPGEAHQLTAVRTAEEPCPDLVVDDPLRDERHRLTEPHAKALPLLRRTGRGEGLTERQEQREGDVVDLRRFPVLQCAQAELARGRLVAAGSRGGGERRARLRAERCVPGKRGRER